MPKSSTIARLVAEAEAIGGTPVRISFDEKLETSARLRLARGSSHHWVIAKPGPASDYFIANQLGVLLRLLSMPPSGRMDFVETGQAANRAQMALEALAGTTGPTGPDYWEPLGASLSRWLLATVRSLPVAMRVDQQLFLSAPDIRESQLVGLRQQNEENLRALISVRKSLRLPPAWCGPIGAFAIFSDRLLGTTGFALPLEAMGLLEKGRELVRIFDRADPSPSGDCALIDAWAESIGIGDWYRWQQPGA